MAQTRVNRGVTWITAIMYIKQVKGVIEWLNCFNSPYNISIISLSLYIYIAHNSRFQIVQGSSDRWPLSPGHNVVIRDATGQGKVIFCGYSVCVEWRVYATWAREERQALLHVKLNWIIRDLNVLTSRYFTVLGGNWSTVNFRSLKSFSIILTAVFRPDGMTSFCAAQSDWKRTNTRWTVKLSPKADVMNLLQAAGFSRSNPYYIVPKANHRPD